MARLVPKIIGIGLPKTGTTSLTAAFKKLGLRTVDHRRRGLSLTGNYGILKNADAIAGQFERVFPAVDRLHPGSRFILTTRDVEPWLESVRRRMEFIGKTQRPDHIHNGWMASYGISYYDEDILRMVHQAHAAMVKSYFAGAKRFSLIEMNIPAGDGWKKLCKFLCRPVPRGSFPHENKAP